MVRNSSRDVAGRRCRGLHPRAAAHLERFDGVALASRGLPHEALHGEDVAEVLVRRAALRHAAGAEPRPWRLPGAADPGQVPGGAVPRLRHLAARPAAYWARPRTRAGEAVCREPTTAPTPHPPLGMGRSQGRASFARGRGKWRRRGRRKRIRSRRSRRWIIRRKRRRRSRTSTKRKTSNSADPTHSGGRACWAQGDREHLFDIRSGVTLPALARDEPRSEARDRAGLR